MGRTQIGIFQVCPKEVGLFQVRPSQGSTFQVRSLENSAFQVCFTEIRPFQVHSCHVALLQCSEIPLLTNESAPQACQRQVAQVYLTQVRPTQIKPQQPSLLPVVPVYWPTPLLVRDQQPLNIAASKFDIFERIDAPLDVRLYCKALRKEFLALEINFWFRAPAILRFVCLLLHEV